MAKENEGFEDLTETDAVVNDSSSSEESEGDSVEDAIESNDADADAESEDAEIPVDDPRIAELTASNTILSTENALLKAENEKWKKINLQLLLEMPNDASIGAEETDDSEMDDPAPYEESSGASNRFEIKE